MVNDINNFLGSFYLTDWVEHRTVLRVDGVKFHLITISVKLFYGILIFISRAFDSDKRKFTLTRCAIYFRNDIIAILDQRYHTVALCSNDSVSLRINIFLRHSNAFVIYGRIKRRTGCGQTVDFSSAGIGDLPMLNGMMSST